MPAPVVADAQRDDGTLTAADLILVYEQGVDELRAAVAGLHFLKEPMVRRHD
jgi:hypothetical protein